MAGEFELKVSKNGKYHFNLKAGNGHIILSGEMYESKAAAENGIAVVKLNAPDADGYRYKINTTMQGQIYFELKARNGQVIGRSGVYESMTSARNGIESVKKNAPDAETVKC